MKLTLLELGAWIDMLFGKSKPGEAFYGGWGNITRDPDFAVATLFHSPGAWTGAHDAKSDQLIDAGKASAKLGGAGQDLRRSPDPSLDRSAAVGPDPLQRPVDRLSRERQGFEVFPTAVNDFWPVEIT